MSQAPKPMYTLRKVILPAIFVSALFYVTLFRSAPPVSRYYGQVMGTTWSAVIRTPQSSEIQQSIQATLDTVNAQMSTYQPDSEISRFSVPELSELPDDIRKRIETVQEKSGFIPNVFLVLARRPAEFRAFMDYHDALMEKESGLSKAEREMIVVTTSAANQCQYCVIAHGAILRIRAKNPLIADQLATNYRKADITPRQKAMLDFAMKVSNAADEISEADYEALREHGFSDEDIWDIAGVTAFFGLSNRMANFTSMRPNTEFYTMGR